MSIDTTSLPPANQRKGHHGHDTAKSRASAAQVLELRVKHNYTWSQIADELGYTDPSNVRKVLFRALDRWEVENVTEMRAIENAKLDADEQALRRIIDAPDTEPEVRRRTVETRVKLSTRRAKLNGLDAPIQVQVQQVTADDARRQLLELLDEQRTVPGEVVDG